MDRSPAAALGRCLGRLGGMGAAGLLGLGATALLASCGGGPISSPDTGVGCSVTVEIPAFQSRLLGSAEVAAQGRRNVITRNSGTVAVPCGLQAKVTAHARQPGTHPFTGWRLGHTVLSSAGVTVTIQGQVVLKAQFRVPHAKPTPTPRPSAGASPSPSASAAPSTVILDKWVSYDPQTKTVTWKVVAGYQGVNHGLNFDGETYGAMAVAVPLGWTVVINFQNAASINHSAAIVSSPSATTPAFAGAQTPNPTTGTAPGQSASFTFVASGAGSYRLTCLVPGHEQAGMWDSFQVSTAAAPTARL
ncbi:MAG: sulfocyanin-like copper-binding protein [Candidatus Dormibacteria bacterium]